MSALKEQSFGSKLYKVLYSTSTGTWFIERWDGATSLREVCSEGWKQYRKLKRAFRQRREEFNSICRCEYQFFDEEGNEL